MESDLTRELEFTNAGTPLGKWYREKLRDSNTGLVIIDIDIIVYLFYDYKKKTLSLVEEKARGDTLHTAQQKTLPELDMVLRAGCRERGIKYLGLHRVRFSGTRPDNSSWIELNGVKILENELIEKLNIFF